MQVADVVYAVGALELEVLGVYTSDEVTLADALEIGIEGSERHTGNIPLVDVERVEVGIAEIGGEPVQGVLGRVGEGCKALEHEVDIRIVADDASVECVVGKLAGGVDTGIVVTQQVEPVYAQRIDVDCRGALADAGPDVGREGALADEVLSDQTAYVEIVGREPAVDTEGLVADYVLDVEVGPGGAGGGVEGAVHLKVGKRARSGAVEDESLAAGQAGEIDWLAWNPLAEEAAQALRGECEILEFAVQPHPGDVVEAGKRDVGDASESGSPVLEVEVVDREIVDGARDPSGDDVSDDIVVLEARCEV